jgi:hypothetical protein
MNDEVKQPENRMLQHKSILELSASEAQNFFFEPRSYSRLDLPGYIRFDKLLEKTRSVLHGKQLEDTFKDRDAPKKYDGVNYTIISNRDGKYAWRPFALIHPVLYISLVYVLTSDDNWNYIKKRFAEFCKNEKIECKSLPVISESDNNHGTPGTPPWKLFVEQRSIELSLDYDYLIQTDISDCYSSIYTHSIPWALHGKSKAKENRRCDQLIGNVIDKHIQYMRYGQTNGIPQGSKLMDFVAEMVLGYADMELGKKLDGARIKDYHILRYRDDYRVFVNNPKEGEQIIKLFSEVLLDLGLKLKPEKTIVSSDVIQASLKRDKLAWILRKHRENNFLDQLLIIRDHAAQFPNAGSLVKALDEFDDELGDEPSLENPMPLIAIVADIAYRNPQTYPICARILTKMMQCLDSQQLKENVAKKIFDRFSQLPNTGYLQIWLQRITLPIRKDLKYEEAMCKLVSGERETLWKSDWLDSHDLRNALDTPIVDKSEIDKLEPVIRKKEVQPFVSNYADGYYG